MQLLSDSLVGAIVLLYENIVPNMTCKTPKVSVCVVAYNQVKYIRECLQSIVDQETDFDFEVIVGDDCSTDGTREIVKEFSRKYPRKIDLVLHKKNVGPSRNYLSVHNLARGEFVAHIDGDDYLLPHKLQTQSDFLDMNQGCQIAWHRMDILNERSKVISGQKFNSDNLVGRCWYIDDIISNITIGLHSSKMYRRWSGANYCNGICLLDFSVNVLQLYNTNGFCAFVDSDSLGVYRTGVGISNNKRQIRTLIYKWLLMFYKNKIGNRNIVASKIFLMVLSDVKHHSGSFWYGLLVLFSVFRSIRFFEVMKILDNSLPISISSS